MTNRLIIRTTLTNLPKIRDRYPFIYLEHGRLEIDDSSVKWISSEREVIRLPAALISTILLGPGTTITHEAVKILASLNTTICWVGDDSLNFYAVGQTPTSNSYNLKKQVKLSSDPKLSLTVARLMYSYRFPEADVENLNLKQLLAMEGMRIKNLYAELAQQYFVNWQGRSYTPGKFELSDVTNKLITAASAALYALVSSIIHSLGFSPRIGFIHSGSPLPFVYDIADLYKKELVFDLAFSLTVKMAGEYNRYVAIDEFRQRALRMNLLTRCPSDIMKLMDIKE